MTVNRKTSTYMLEVDGADVNLLIGRLDTALLAGSGVSSGTPFVKFRSTDDLAADEAALGMVGNLKYRLTTGYGVNLRVVAEPYEGECWSCKQEFLVIHPDPGMEGTTDEVLCLCCDSAQSG